MRASLENRAMVKRQIAGRGIRSRRVVGAFLRVDRRHFAPPSLSLRAYADHPLPIAAGQTVSQPFMVALMLDALEIERGHKVLEIGSGSGYVLALLAAMGAKPFGVEWHAELIELMRLNLVEAGFPGIPCRVGDGGEGWPGEAPFDRILVSASCPAVPSPLLAQLAVGGILAAPVDKRVGSILMRYSKNSSGEVRSEALDRCAFVPLLGHWGKG